MIQQWGIRFEGDANNPLFNQVYTALKARLDEFPDENEARQKLGKPIRTPVKDRSQKSNQSDTNPYNRSPLDVVPVQDSSMHKKNKKKKKSKTKSKKIVLSETQKVLK